MLAKSLETDETLYELNAHKLMMPASAAKILTLAAAAERLGWQYAYLIPYGGYTLFDSSLRFPHAPLKDKLDLGGRLGWQFRSWIGIELASGFTATQEDTTPATDVDFLHASGNVVFTPWVGRYGGPCRPPRGPLSDVHREQVRADMGRALAALGVA